MEPGGGNNDFSLFNPSASVIYPGSLHQGKSLKKPTPDVIAVERAGGGLPFDVKKVGAGIGFHIGEKQFYLLFNYTGTQYCISGDVNGTGKNEFIGPFDL